MRVRKQLSTFPTHLPSSLFPVFAKCYTWPKADATCLQTDGRMDAEDGLIWALNRRTTPSVGTDCRPILSADGLEGARGIEQVRCMRFQTFRDPKFELKGQVPFSLYGGLKREERPMLAEVIRAPFYPLLGLLWGEHSSTIAHHSCSLEVGERVSGLIMLVGRMLQMLSHSPCSA